MNKRLTEAQKIVACYVVLIDAKYPMSATAIGKAIGFKTGRSVHKVLCDMYDHGLLSIREEELMGQATYYFWLTEKGREEAKKIGLQD